MVQFFKRKKIIYVNFLPLWNFLLFYCCLQAQYLGQLQDNKINSQNHFERFLRKYIMPYTFQISMSIINFRKLDILFATESLKHIVEKKSK